MLRFGHTCVGVYLSVLRTSLLHGAGREVYFISTLLEQHFLVLNGEMDCPSMVALSKINLLYFPLYLGTLQF